MELQNILKDEKIQKGLKQNLFTIDEDRLSLHKGTKSDKRFKSSLIL